MNFEQLPNELKSYPWWVLWKYEAKKGAEKQAKIPYTLDGKRADPTDPIDCFPFETVSTVEGYSGIGMALMPGCGFVGIDLDGTSDWKDEAKEIIARFRGRAYLEKSPSGNGVRIICRGYLPAGSRNRAKHFYGGKVEIYEQGRFLTITGDRGEGSPTEDISDIIAEFVAPLNAAGGSLVATEITDPKLHRDPNLTDDQVLAEMAGNASAGKPGAVTFMRIWREGFDDDEDPSDALTSAVNSLVCETQNIEQVRRILERSEHISAYEDRRTGAPKFDRWFKSEVPKILRRKIDELEAQGAVVDEAHERYVWVIADGMWYDRMSGVSCTKGSLNDAYRLTNPHPLISTELLQDDRVRRVDLKGWMPSRFGDTSLDFLEHAGARLVNTWRGYAVSPMEGSVEPWIELVAHLVPNPEEREHVIDRIAYDIQHPEVMCSWHLVVIGPYGAGKDALIMPLAKIFGDAYSTIENDDIKSQYDDGFAKRKIIHVNELRGLGGGALEKLKSRAAPKGSEWTKLNIKSEKQVLHPQLWSFYIFTNHDDAMNIDARERRFFVVKAPKEMPEDMKPRYFGWLNKDGGPAKLFRFLLDRDLSHFDPFTLPKRTEAFYEMVQDSQSEAQTSLELLEEQGRLGKGLVHLKAFAQDYQLKASDVKKFLVDRGWKNLPQPQKKGEKAKSRSWWAPQESPLHAMATAEVWEAIHDHEKEAMLLGD